MILRLSLILCLCACSGPGYYVQALSGQYKLLRSRQDIQTLLQDPATSPELVEHLAHAEQIRSYAENVLDLPADGSYTTYAEVEGDRRVFSRAQTVVFSGRRLRALPRLLRSAESAGCGCKTVTQGHGCAGLTVPRVLVAGLV